MGGVERFGIGHHGNKYASVAKLDYLARQSVSLVAYHEDVGRFDVESVKLDRCSVKCGGKDASARCAKGIDCSFDVGANADVSAQYRTHRSAQSFAIVYIGTAIVYYDLIDSECRGGTNDRAEISRILDRNCHE